MKSGAFIKREREKAGLSQEQLAAKIHVTPQQMAMYEDDTLVFTIPGLMGVADALKIPVANLLKNNIDPAL
jgi:transcriptional regulator with XRE-family HTH domain